MFSLKDLKEAALIQSKLDQLEEIKKVFEELDRHARKTDPVRYLPYPGASNSNGTVFIENIYFYDNLKRIIIK